MKLVIYRQFFDWLEFWMINVPGMFLASPLGAFGCNIKRKPGNEPDHF
jgi:hypothetical protein